jgi:hypothetical protein
MTESTKEDISLKELILILIDWWRYFLSRWKLIALIVVIGGGIGLAVAMLSKTTYLAELTFALEDKGSANPYSGIASQFGIDVGGGAGGGAFSGENNIEILKSRYIIEKTLLTPVVINGKQDLLINRYIEFNHLRDTWTENDNLKNISFTEDEPRDHFGISKDSILASIYYKVKETALSVSRVDKKLSIIKVEFRSEDEIFAKLFTEIIVQTASGFYITTKVGRSRSNLDILQSRLDSVKRELDKEIYGVALSKDRNLNPIRAEGGIQSAKKQLNVQILTTMYGELIKNTELAKYTLMREEPLLQIIDRPILPLEKKKKSKITSTISGAVLGGVFAIILLWLRKIKASLMNAA